jgi:hypothetical protein
VLILKTKDATCPEEAYWAYSAMGESSEFVQKITAKDIKDFVTGFEALSPLPNPKKNPHSHHVVHLTGGYEDKYGEWVPDFSINGKRTRLWPNIVWCHVPECAEDDHACQRAESSTVEDTVLEMKFCQSKNYVISNVGCDEFKCNETLLADASKAALITRTNNGRCFNAGDWKDGKIKDPWEKVNVSDCHLYKLRPIQYTYSDDALEVCYGDRVWLTYVDDGTKETHPIHLHGTHQQLIKVNGEWINGGNGTWMDTWFTIRGANLTVAFDAVNPGEWLMHCHIEHHLMNGMATTLRYVMNERCEERLDKGEVAPQWVYTKPVQPEEWPEDWITLWNKTRPKASISTVEDLP